MPKIVTALKEEIIRVTRKEIRQETATTKRATAQYRRDIAALKREVKDLQSTVALLEKKVLARPIKDQVKPTEKKIRFSPKSLQAQRKRLGLSVTDYSKLVGVSQVTIYSWENGKSRPRPEQIATLAALRGLSKREALARLNLIGSK